MLRNSLLTEGKIFDKFPVNTMIMWCEESTDNCNVMIVYYKLPISFNSAWSSQEAGKSSCSKWTENWRKLITDRCCLWNRRICQCLYHKPSQNVVLHTAQGWPTNKTDYSFQSGQTRECVLGLWAWVQRRVSREQELMSRWNSRIVWLFI